MKALEKSNHNELDTLRKLDAEIANQAKKLLKTETFLKIAMSEKKRLSDENESLYTKSTQF
jgi:hypothetical protein